MHRAFLFLIPVFLLDSARAITCSGQDCPMIDVQPEGVANIFNFVYGGGLSFAMLAIGFIFIASKIAVSGGDEWRNISFMIVMWLFFGGLLLRFDLFWDIFFSRPLEDSGRTITLKEGESPTKMSDIVKSETITFIIQPTNAPRTVVVNEAL